MKNITSQISPYVTNSTKTMPIETAKLIFKAVLKSILELIVLVLLAFFSLISSIGLMLLLCVIFLTVKKDVKMAFADPEDVNYECKTDKELFTFVAHCCITAFLFAIISFQIFLYIALLFWFYFIVFVLMFSRVWKFHGKKRIHFFAILISGTVISFIAAPFARDVIHVMLSSFLRH